MGHPLCSMMMMLPVTYWPTCCGVDGFFVNI
jgi:hypothetical protein